MTPSQDIHSPLHNTNISIYEYRATIYYILLLVLPSNLTCTVPRYDGVDHRLRHSPRTSGNTQIGLNARYARKKAFLFLPNSPTRHYKFSRRLFSSSVDLFKPCRQPCRIVKSLSQRLHSTTVITPRSPAVSKQGSILLIHTCVISFLTGTLCYLGNFICSREAAAQKGCFGT